MTTTYLTDRHLQEVEQVLLANGLTKVDGKYYLQYSRGIMTIMIDYINCGIQWNGFNAYSVEKFNEVIRYECAMHRIR